MRRVEGGRIARRVLGVAAGIGVIAFAVQGGEYGTADLFRQQARHERLRAEVDSLQHEVDSLELYRRAILEDPVTQERIAREVFGMIRPGELLYRFDRDDATDSAAAEPRGP